MSPATRNTLAAIALTVLNQLAAQYLRVEPVAQEKALYQERASRRLSKVYEKKRTIADLELALAEARAYCAGVEDAP